MCWLKSAKCTKCHHEWQFIGEIGKCIWCNAPGEEIKEMKTDLGNPLRPRVICLKCEVVIYCDKKPRPETEKILRHMHENTKCKGKIEFRNKMGVGI